MRDRRAGKRYPYLWAVLYGTFLTGYAVFTLLDAFVLPRDMVYLEDIADMSSADEAASGGDESGQGAEKMANLEDAVEPEKTSGSKGTAESEETSGSENASGTEGAAETEEKTESEKTAGAETEKAAGMNEAADAERTETGEPSSSESDKSGGTIESEEPVEPIVTDSSYESAGISIVITAQREYDTDIYVADVTIQDVSYLRAGLAGGAFGRNLKETTSKMAEENEAILAVNGDYYGFRDKGFVMRNGYLYRDTARAAGDDEALVIYGDGHMEIISESDADVQALAEEAVQIFSFGPGLIGEGEILVNEYSEVEQAMRSNPRTAIGEISPLHYILLVSDGRTKESEGLSLWELARVMQELGCVTAYNLDGGGSSTMWFMGGIVNHPTSGWHSGERSVSDIVYIGE